MKIGIIIIFQNNEHNLDTKLITKQFQLSKDFVFCLVNNESTDNTSDVLETLKEDCLNISIINIKKHLDEVAAVRAGARFMFNQYNLKHIGFINFSNLLIANYNLKEIVTLLHVEKESIIDYNKKIIGSMPTKQTLFKRIFSVVEYLLELQLLSKYKFMS